MKRLTLTSLAVLLCAASCLAQASGNVAYSNEGRGQSRAEQNERNKRAAADVASQTGMFIDASVLANVKADEHVAVFGVTAECAAVPECGQKVDAAVASFTRDVRQLGVAPDDVFVDFVAQNKIYAYQIEGNIAREKLVGFELKKNVLVHYKDRLLLDKLVVAASRSDIFDLIKVDYVVRDPAAVQSRLAEEAARVVREKAARYEKLLGKRMLPAQVYADKPSIYYPTEMYDSYTAQESEQINQDYYSNRERYTVQRARKSRTFFFNALTADNFDHVINPVVTEPVVQFTLYLKVRYEMP
ncbi:MAG TPA: SIMPL domain-containing protein [Pyrinomonadaceae bacterium]|nr:SIMPL domain-containing protein [Pyrinomonadaceae bacterium]